MTKVKAEELKTKNALVDTTKKMKGVSAEVKFSTKPYADWEGDPIVITATIEYSNATIDDILPDANKSVIIRWQNRMRKDPDALIAMNGTKIVIDATEKGQRGDMGPRRAINLIGRKIKDGSMTKKEVLKLIEDLQGK